MQLEKAMDRVILNGIRCQLRVGVLAEERRVPQDCLVDVELGRDLRRPMHTDDLLDSLDYARVFEIVQDLAREEDFALLERFAGRLEDELRAALQFESLLLRVKKLRPPLGGTVDFAAVEICRAGSEGSVEGS
jgi:dihydroneopterin aldolase